MRLLDSRYSGWVSCRYWLGEIMRKNVYFNATLLTKVQAINFVTDKQRLGCGKSVDLKFDRDPTGACEGGAIDSCDSPVARTEMIGGEAQLGKLLGTC